MRTGRSTRVLVWAWCALIGSGLVACATPGDSMSLPDAPVSAGWEVVTLPGKSPTRYSIDLQEGSAAWRAEAHRSASMIKYRLGIAPERLSSVEFSWWVDRLIPGANLAEAGEGDAPARMMLAFEGDRSRFSARNRMISDMAEAMGAEPLPYATLMYVWSNQHPPETVLIHPRTDRIRKIVLEQGDVGLRQWRRYQRNVVRDFELAFGEPPGALAAVALMTDADNLSSSAVSWYGPIRFGEDPWLPLPPVGTRAASVLSLAVKAPEKLTP